MKKTEPDPSADIELQGAMMHVVVVFGIGLRLEETIANVGKEGVTVLQQYVHS
jgi:homoserine dehydrogenase